MRLFSCWISILILPFVREIAGATYLLLFPNENQELPCPLSPNQYHTDWWVGSACSSLLTFEQMGLTSYEWPPKKSYSTNWERFVHICTSGGIFACRAWTDGEMTRQTPLLNNPEHCRHFHFFIVAKINESENEAAIESIHNQPKAGFFVSPGENFSLSCQFALQKEVDFVVYWIKETHPATCLHSLSNEGFQTVHNISYDINCCVDSDIKKRLSNSSEVSNGTLQNHQITITDAVPSDSGVYVCLITAFTNKHFWKIVTNVTIEVRDALAPESGNGKPSEPHQRDRTATEMKEEECSPYAISSHSDVFGNEVVYSLATSPGVNPNRDFLQNSSTASGTQAGENVETYAVINKVCS
ncbi:Programmed cell death 1 ligand 1 [Varanus komodoensis]|nr:Programmed cell death 1 ligand 1 [Varanus komodoensis]